MPIYMYMYYGSYNYGIEAHLSSFPGVKYAPAYSSSTVFYTSDNVTLVLVFNMHAQRRVILGAHAQRGLQ